MKILTKDLLNTWSYSTMSHDRSGYKFVKISGRDYIKLGDYQAVTLVGNLYDVYDADVKHSKKMLFVGVARQHPRDLNARKEVGYEVANTAAYEDPQIVMEVGPNFTAFNFREFAKNYIDSLDLNFVATPTELKEAEEEYIEFIPDENISCDC